MKITKVLNTASLVSLILCIVAFITVELVIPFELITYDIYHLSGIIYKTLFKTAVVLCFISFIYKEKKNDWKIIKKYKWTSIIIAYVLILNVIIKLIFHKTYFLFFFIFAIPTAVKESEKGVAEEYKAYKERVKEQNANSK